MSDLLREHIDQFSPEVLIDMLACRGATVRPAVKVRRAGRVVTCKTRPLFWLAPFLIEKVSKQAGRSVQCRNDECGYREAG